MNIPCKLYIRRKLDNCSIRLKYIIKASFSLRKCQEPVRHETTDGSSVEFIGQRKQNGKFELINSRHARRLSRLLKTKTNGTTGPSSVNDNG